jgi:hypothetical protein
MGGGIFIVRACLPCTSTVQGLPVGRGVVTVMKDCSENRF